MVTVTVTAPAGFAGVTAVMVVEFTTTTPVAATPPKVTVAPLTKPVPVMVTLVPPPVVPEGGLTFVIVGAGVAENSKDTVTGDAGAYGPTAP